MIAKHQIPNLLTMARIGAVPIALAATTIATPNLFLFWLFILASLTDFLDGYLARRWQCTSPTGAMLDPVADKLLVAFMLLYLLAHFSLPLLPVATILLREIYVSGLREFLSGRGFALPVSRGGKWKTALQMAGISALLASLGYNLPMLWSAGMLAIWGSAALAVHSAFHYTRSALSQMSTTR